MDLFQVIKERRLLLRVTQQDLADISGIGLRTIKLIETGKGNPSIKTLSELGDVLGVELVFQIKQLNTL